MKISKNALKKLQEAEVKLTGAGFHSVWQKTVERFPYDDLYSFWVNLETGKTILLKTHSDQHNPLDGVFVYEVNEINQEDLKPERTSQKK